SRAGDPVTADAVVGERKLQAEKIVARLSSRGLDEESSLTAPDFDLERDGPAKLCPGVPENVRKDLLVPRGGPAPAARRRRLGQARDGTGRCLGFIRPAPRPPSRTLGYLRIRRGRESEFPPPECPAEPSRRGRPFRRDRGVAAS